MSSIDIHEMKMKLEEQGCVVEVILHSILIINKKIEYSPALNKWLDKSGPLPLVCQGGFEVLLCYLKVRS